MDEIQEINDTTFDLKSYINNKHTTYNISILKTSLNRLENIKKKNNNKLIKMFDTSKINYDLIKEIDKLNIKLKEKIKKSELKEKINIIENTKEFYSELNIKKFKDSLKKFQENLDIFITEKRRLEFESKCLIFKKNDINSNDNKFEDFNWIEGVLILTNDILIVGRKETNGYLLINSFLYDILEKDILKDNLNIKFFKNIPKIDNIEKKEFSILSIKSPSNIIFILMETNLILNALTVYDKCIFKKTKKKKLNKKFKKLEYLLFTEQYDKLQDLIEKNKNKEVILKEEEINKELFMFNKNNYLNKNSSFNKIVNSLDNKSNTYEELFILLQIVDPVFYLSSIYKQNFPKYEIDNYIELYFNYFNEFIKESNEILKEVRNKNNKIEIVEINLLLKEKITNFTIKKCMKQVLWRGRKTNEVDELFNKIKTKVDLKYLLEDYKTKIEKWKENRKEFIKFQMKDISKKISEKI